MKTNLKSILKATWKVGLGLFGGIDTIKVRSCMTLFDVVCPNEVFSEVLDAF